MDEEQTKKLRDQERAERKRRGLKFAEFEKGWREKRPSDEVMEFYGEWPEKRYEKFSYFGQWPGVERQQSGEMAAARP
jgi:hypothetical protein